MNNRSSSCSRPLFVGAQCIVFGSLYMEAHLITAVVAADDLESGIRADPRSPIRARSSTASKDSETPAYRQACRQQNTERIRFASIPYRGLKVVVISCLCVPAPLDRLSPAGCVPLHNAAWPRADYPHSHPTRQATKTAPRTAGMPRQTEQRCSPVPAAMIRSVRGRELEYLSRNEKAGRCAGFGFQAQSRAAKARALKQRTARDLYRALLFVADRSGELNR